jgi:hypothetical protein
MFEFQWRLPGKTEQAVILRVRSRRGWIARKEIIVGPGTVVRRGYFSGINADLPLDGAAEPARLRLVNTPGQNDWRPALFHEGRELPELTGTIPPYVPTRPKLLANVTGLTYLCMFLAIIVTPSIRNILESVRLPHDQRSFVLYARDRDLPAERLSCEPQALPPATRGEPYSAGLSVTGGTPPYTWLTIPKGWPNSMILDARTGVVSFTPKSRYDQVGEFVVVDSFGERAMGVFVIEVQTPEAEQKDWPVITTGHLPTAVRGESYVTELEFTGGRPPHTWKLLSGRLPDGLEFDSEAGRIAGELESERPFDVAVPGAVTFEAGKVPEALAEAFGAVDQALSSEARMSPGLGGEGWRITDTTGIYELTAFEGGWRVHQRMGIHPLMVSLRDGSYDASQDILPWAIPIGVTSLCLLGYWNMRKWSVYLFGPLILAQVVVFVLSLTPVATTGLVLQAGLWVVGFVHLDKMK